MQMLPLRLRGRRRLPWLVDAPAQTRTKGSKAGWIALGLIAALLVAGAAGLCVYANQYDKVFPGVSLGERDLSGMTEQQLRKELTAGGLLSGEVSITAAGEELGRYTQEDLGAYIDGRRAA